jgi:hypothetical protein
MGLIAVDERSDDALVAAGRVCLRTWTRLCAAGYGYHPCEAPAMAAYHADRARRPGKLSRAECIAADRVLRDTFALAPNALPVWLFRTGQADPVPHSERTLRRAIDDVFSAPGQPS